MREQTKPWVQITPAYENTPIAHYMQQFDHVLHMPHVVISHDPLCSLIHIEHNGKHYYLKYYRRAGKYLRRFFGLSRPKREWINLLYFAKHGIPTANVVAYGEQRRGWIYSEGMLMTEEVANTTDLALLARNGSSIFRQKVWFKQLIDTIALYTRRLHDAQFIHNDLKWRNILVDPKGSPTPYFIDCPCGRIKKGIFYRRGIIKDLACLDKLAKAYLSRTQRLRFYLQYQQTETLTKKHKKTIKKILHFFDD